MRASPRMGQTARLSYRGFHRQVHAAKRHHRGLSHRCGTGFAALALPQPAL